MDRIINFINEKGNFKWFTAEFASLGFIGKLFHTKDLPYLINYIALLYRYKPVDWILDSVFMDRYCLPFEKAKPCYKRQKDYRVPGGTLFQHIGIHSSLEGKIQKLKEKNFGQSNTFSAHTDNPKAVVNTSLKQFKEYGIQNFYDGRSLFWSSVPPTFGDYINIHFTDQVHVKGFIIRSGNPEHPDDKFDNRTVVLTKSGAEGSAFEKLCTFNERGIARHHFAVPTSLQAIRLEVQTNYTNWLLLSELHIRHS
uniref:Alpha-1,3-mannosyl-glycoprotein 4-beta-N-acetylglucosaminyltransferase B n=1 Tax=Anisakis pegreffii TaxID=303229 RepID=A0A3G6JBM4_9BILA|nr:alpha-1,3-mannosyl-glycoprotein 4-beta-N-acetylglucosaminyltransferase B [Anisakis pegreffii]